MEPWSNPAPMKFPEMVSATAKRLGHKFDKLGHQGCQGIDALVYINLVDLRSGVYRYLFPAEFSQTDDVAKIRSQGWRSASILMVPYATVLFATDAAPSFLQEYQGRVLKAPDGIVSRLFTA
jgi:hypothetical protein